ncbi:MAG: hypothetical protein QOF56_2233, partial [Acidobacteriaceae bacterium]|nr:hypothetical protein [Acidobacteriaceae bacterium]
NGAGDGLADYFDGVDAREGIVAIGDGRIAQEEGSWRGLNISAK